jgi:PAS domain S-box-containing protein
MSEQESGSADLVPASEPEGGELSWSKQVAGAVRRVASLRERAGQPLFEDSALIQEALQELDTAQEELRVAEEQLHAQVDMMHEVQAKLARERQRYRELFEAAPEPYLVTDVRGHVQDANRRAAALFNIEIGFLIGKPLSLFIHIEHRAQLRAALGNSQLDAQVANYQWRIAPRRGQEPLWTAVSVSRAPSADGSGHVLRWMFRRSASVAHAGALPVERAESGASTPAFESLLARETAARRSAESQLQERDGLLAATAHELRSPLSSIAGWLELLGSERSDSSMRERAFASMQRSVRGLSFMVEQLVDNARFAEGVLMLEMGRVQLAKIVQSSLDEHGPSARRKGIRLHAQLAEELEVQADSWRLQQVVSNLLGNALKFTPEAGDVTITLARHADHAELRVKDSGYGIAPDALATIFQPFVQVHNRAQTGHSGLGLGLDIARRLVELHGGTIKAESAGEGRGSTFTVRLPLAL